MKRALIIGISGQDGAYLAAEVCKRAIYLRQGQIVFDGETKEALEKYNTAEGVAIPAE